MKPSLLFIIFSILCVQIVAQSPLPPLPPEDGCANQRKMLMLGDSWAQYMYDDNVHNTALKMYGHADKTMYSESFEIALFSGDPDPQGTYYSVSGSEARQWVDEGTYAYMQNVRDALVANPSINLVEVSIGGNDVLAGRSDCGWYKNMDSDPNLFTNCGVTDEEDFFDKVEADIQYIIDEVLAIRPDIYVIISSYDYPNFNVTTCWLGCLCCSLCNQYACPKREDLSYDLNGNGSIDGSELITDAEINQMMEKVETRRRAMADANPRILYDNAMGLMHYYYGDGTNAPGTLPHPQGTSPYAAGGNPNAPALRENFRLVDIPLYFDAPADPIHLTAEGYLYKAKNQMDNFIFDMYRGNPEYTFFSENANDGYIYVYDDNDPQNVYTNDGIRLGDDGVDFWSNNNEFYGVLSFDTGTIPSNATILGASIYLIRSSDDDNPFFHNDRSPVMDIKSGNFGSSAGLQLGDWNAAASANNIGCFNGQADENKYAIRIDVDPSALSNVNKDGRTQFRLYFDYADWSPENITFYGGGDLADSRIGNGSIEEVTHEDQRIVAGKGELFSEFKIKRIKEDGVEKEIILEKGKVIKKEEGMVYEKIKLGTEELEDGSLVETYRLLPALEHPGLAQYMGNNYNGGTPLYRPFIDIWTDLQVPVELASFTAIPVGRNAQLDWTTAAERNTSLFEIEHSTDAARWSLIGKVDAAGESTTPKDYTFTHTKPAVGINYYRLKMLDKDGSFEYSDIENVAFRPFASMVEVFPNPFENSLEFKFNLENAENINIVLMDVLGKVIYEENVFIESGVQAHIINDFKDLSTGAYFLRISTKDTSSTIKVMKGH